jgi:pyruvate,water dikinase
MIRFLRDHLFTKSTQIGLKKGERMGSDQMIFWFEDIGKEHNDIVGKKCANLGEMMRRGLNVPPGFAIAIDVYRKFIRETKAADEMSRYVKGLGDVRGKGIDIFEEMSQILQGAIEDKAMPPAIESEICRYYEELCQRIGVPDAAVSVRSAGTESRPGMFETYLNVRGGEDVLKKVMKVWASAYTPRAIAFRVTKGFPILGDELGVAVPKMVNARASGVGFTVDPVTGEDINVIIEANWGLGEGVVSGAESVDGFVVKKAGLEVTERHVGHKSRRFVSTANGAAWEDVDPDKQNVSCLRDQEIREIAKIAVFLEEQMGCAQDMEWAIDRDLPFPQNIFHLQVRPAKVQAKKQASATDRILDLIAARYQRP